MTIQSALTIATDESGARPIGMFASFNGHCSKQCSLYALETNLFASKTFISNRLMDTPINSAEISSPVRTFRSSAQQSTRHWRQVIWQVVTLSQQRSRPNA
jgi:hypothetical protein